MHEPKRSYILLTGHRKSGTTLLHRLFDSHPQLNIFPVDLSLLYAFLPCHIQNSDIVKTRERVNMVLMKSLQGFNNQIPLGSSARFSAEDYCSCLWEYSDPSDLRDSASIIDAIACAWCIYTESDPSKPFLFKETSQSIHAHSQLQNQLLIRIIQIIRDPRDNYSAIKAGSKYYKSIGEGQSETLASLINRCRMDLLAASCLKSENHTWFYPFRFEDLVDHSEDIMLSLSSFCDIEYDPILLNPTLHGKPFSGNSFEGCTNGISSANVGRWRERISHSEAAVIEFWMKDVMRDWGYSVEIDPIDTMNAFSAFYNWYNCRYFYYDSFIAENA